MRAALGCLRTPNAAHVVTPAERADCFN